MQYEIDASNPLQLNWSAKGVQRILQNIQNIIHTWRYEVAYNRTMGITTATLEKPLERLKAEYISQVYQIVPDYEPRASVKEVKFISVNDEGDMDFKVVVDI